MDMGDLTVREEPRIRIATQDDIPLLARHHRMMFEEIWEQGSKPFDPQAMSVLEQEYTAKLSSEFTSGSCRAWVVQESDRIVSSGAVSIVPYVPTPLDPQIPIAFLHSIYTEKEFRHQHHARRITEEASEYCRNRGIKRLYLFASDAGRPLYASLGFTPVPNMMLLLQ
jgi:GNAT superfamily N-acetyltransferase